MRVTARREVSVASFFFFCSRRLFPGGVSVQQVDVRQQRRQRQHCECQVLNSGGVVSDRLKAPEQKQRFFFSRFAKLFPGNVSRLKLASSITRSGSVKEYFLFFNDVTAGRRIPTGSEDQLRLQAKSKTALPVLQKKKKKMEK